MRIVTTPITAPLEWPPARPPQQLAELREAFLAPPGSPATELLDKALAPDTLMVTTGQQPALFTGPLYTIHKALSAAALARHLEERWQRPVQAVFWIAGDDHDFTEASHTAWPDVEGRVARATLRERPADADLTPMYRELLGAEVTAALTRLERDLPGSDFKQDALAWLARYYRPDATVAGSFAGALAELLAPFGVLCFDNTHRAAKRATARHVIKALGLARDLDHDLAGRSRELAGAGHDAGVTAGDGATLVMLESGLGRDRLVLDGNGFVTRRSGERFSMADLQRVAADQPERLSGNVLLRPVLESALLPTVAYVAGPGELRYLPLAAPVYDRMRVHRQLPVPRWSGILVEPRVDRTLGKYEATLEDLLAPARALETRVVRSQLPPGLVSGLEDLRRSVERLYGRVQPLALEVDPNLARPVDNARRHALSESRDLEKRVVAHLRRRHETEMAQIERARLAVFPEGKPQERVFGIVPYLSRYGPLVMDQLNQTITHWYAQALEAEPPPS